MPVYECIVTEGNLCLKLDVADKKEAFRYMSDALAWFADVSPFYWKDRMIGFEINEINEVNEVGEEDE